MLVAPPPLTSKQAFAAVQAVLAKEATPCSETWTKMNAEGLTMAGPPWRVTVTLTSKAGNGAAVWLVSTGKTTPSNALAKTLSSGC